MRYDPRSQQLYTDNGQLIKKLNCPQNNPQLRWVSGKLRCKDCSRKIEQAHLLTELDLLQLMQSQPETCLLVAHGAGTIQIEEDHEERP